MKFAVELEPVSGARDDRLRAKVVVLRRGADTRAAPLAEQCLTDGGEATVIRPVLEVQGQAPPPVGMLVVAAARQVGLLDDAKDVLGLHHQYLSLRPRQVGVDGHHQGRRHLGHGIRMDARARGQQSLAFQSHQEAGAILGTLHDQIAALVVRGEELQCATGIEVAAFPETAQRRQIMGADRHQGLTRIIGRWLEAAILSPLEQERSVGQHAESWQDAGRKPSGTVPRSSPITMQWLRWLSSATMPSRSSSG